MCGVLSFRVATNLVYKKKKKREGFTPSMISCPVVIQNVVVHGKVENTIGNGIGSADVGFRSTQPNHNATRYP